MHHFATALCACIMATVVVGGAAVRMPALFRKNEMICCCINTPQPVVSFVF